MKKLVVPLSGKDRVKLRRLTTFVGKQKATTVVRVIRLRTLTQLLDNSKIKDYAITPTLSELNSLLKLCGYYMCLNLLPDNFLFYQASLEVARSNLVRLRSERTHKCSRVSI